MKKIYVFLGLSFLLFSASFSFANKRHDIIIQHYQETHPENQNFYTLETIEGNEDLNNPHLVLTGEELTNNKDYIDVLIEKIPDLHIILNVEENDGLVTNGSLSLKQDLALHMRKLTIMNLAQDVKAIGNYFMINCENLTQLDFSLLNNITEIGSYFLANCTELTQLNSLKLNKVTGINAGFLLDCNKLTELNLASLNGSTEIGNYFLYGCSNLTQLDFSTSNYTYIGNYFLFQCPQLKECSQIILPEYNPILKTALKATFPANPEGTNTDIGNMLREVYVEGYVPISKNIKRAQQ